MFFNFRRLHFSSTISVVSQPTIVLSYNFWTVKYTAIHERPTIFLDASYNPSVILSYQRKKKRKQHLNQDKCFHFIFFYQFKLHQPDISSSALLSTLYTLHLSKQNTTQNNHLHSHQNYFFCIRPTNLKICIALRSKSITEI